MRKIKKLFTAMVAVIMALCMALFAACGSTEVDENTNTGNGENAGNTTSTGSGSTTGTNGTTQTTQTISADDDAKIIAMIEAFSAVAETTNTSIKQSNLNSADGTVNSSYTTTTKINYDTLDFDYVIKQESGTDISYLYEFMRNYKVFTYQSETNVADFSNVTLTYQADISEKLSETLSYILENYNFGISGEGSIAVEVENDYSVDLYTDEQAEGDVDTAGIIDNFFNASEDDTTSEDDSSSDTAVDEETSIIALLFGELLGSDDIFSDFLQDFTLSKPLNVYAQTTLKRIYKFANTYSAAYIKDGNLVIDL